MSLKRAISVSQMKSIKFDIMQFEGDFQAAFGKPQLGGTWIIWGNSSNGKTSLCLQLGKYMTNFARVAYNSYEEGISLSFQNALDLFDMHEVERLFYILDGDSIDDLRLRLNARKTRKPRIVFMDSVQHSKLTVEQYKALKRDYSDVLFIYISHARGKLPKGEVADFIRYDADLKIRVEGFRAFVDGRINDSKGMYFDIFPERSKIYYNEV